MKLRSFLNERLGFLIANILLVLFMIILFSSLRVDIYAIILISILFILLNSSLLFYEYRSKSAFIKELNESLDGLEAKYLLSELMNKPSKDENYAIYNILKECNKAMMLVVK